MLMKYGYVYVQNYGFVPGSFNKAFIIHHFVYGCIVIGAYLIVHDEIHYRIEFEETGEERCKLDPFPFIVMLFLVTLRILIVSVRHATTPTYIYKQWFGSKSIPADEGKTIIAASWI